MSQNDVKVSARWTATAEWASSLLILAGALLIANTSGPAQYMLGPVLLVAGARLCIVAARRPGRSL